MTSRAAPMAEGHRGEGERREAATRRKRLTVIGALIASGLVVGFYVGYTDQGAMLDREGSWSPTLSLALLAIFLTVVLGGATALESSTDELQRQVGYKAVSAAGGVYMTAYPTWFILWKGGFVPEPMHGPLFALFWVTLLLSTLWYRFR